MIPNLTSIIFWDGWGKNRQLVFGMAILKEFFRQIVREIWVGNVMMTPAPDWCSGGNFRALLVAWESETENQ